MVILSSSVAYYPRKLFLFIDNEYQCTSDLSKILNQTNYIGLSQYATILFFIMNNLYKKFFIHGISL